MFSAPPFLLLLLLVCESLCIGKCVLRLLIAFELDQMFFCFPMKVVLLRNQVALGVATMFRAPQPQACDLDPCQKISVSVRLMFP